MALDLTASRYNQFGSEMKTLHSSVASIEEGSALVAVLENGEQVVKPSTGAATEVFAGIALSSPVNVKEVPFFELVVAPTGGGAVDLAYTPVTGTVKAMYTGIGGGTDGNALTVDGDAPSGAGDSQISGKTITFHSGDAGRTIRVTYRRALTVTESNALFGDRILDPAQGTIGATGSIVRGEYVFTSMWDPASNWYKNEPGPVYTFAGGLFSLNTNGTLLRGVSVYKAPTPAYPFLGLRLSV